MASLATKRGCRDTGCSCLKEKTPTSPTTTYPVHKYSSEIPRNIEEERRLMNRICQTNSLLTSELFSECPHCNNNNQDFCYEFVQKLAELRECHKKTLNFWQDLYEKNCINERAAVNRMTEHVNGKRSKDIYPVHKINVDFNANEPYENNCTVHEKDSCKNIDRNQQILENVKKRNYFKRKAKRKKKKSTQSIKDDGYECIPCRALSCDESQWNNQFSELPDYIEDTEDSNLELNSPEYCEPFTKMQPAVHRSCSFIDKYQNEKNDWHHGITVPKPFNMTLREANKKKKKSKTLLDFERECEENRRQEECECKKLFKASPVPAHVYMPLYDEITKKKDRQRSISQKNRKEYLESLQQPFSFAGKNNERNVRPSSCISFVESEKKKHKKLKDKPISRCTHSFDKTATELERMRKLNKMLRAQELGDELLSTPKGLETSQKLREEVIHDNLNEKKNSFTPSIHKCIPDYDVLHKQFQKELSKKKKLRKNTVTQPFCFHTEDVALKRYIAKQEKNMYEGSKSYNNLPVRRRKSFSCPDTTHTIPSKTTTSCQLRKSANLMKIENQNSKECVSNKSHKHLKKEIQDKVRSYHRNPVAENKIPSYIKQQQDYLKELQDIYQRLKNRPLLFEQVETKNAKNKAEEKFYKTLKEYGIDKNDIDVDRKRRTKYRTLSPDLEDKGFRSEGDTTKYSRCPAHGNSVAQYEDFLRHHCEHDNANRYLEDGHHSDCCHRHLSDSSSQESLSSDLS
ncbi:protein FAM161B-like [Octopus sinensis]|uniref:Protein FAM161B-like n=1 Tax=Octopus sinensis TaxID=2607531 RepID=A0A6P7SZL6_9MOLL|nr:protein FAM161B-like [Octopus sinensis]